MKSAMGTRFSYYILATCLTKQLLIFNILRPLIKIKKIFTPHEPIRSAIFLYANDKLL